MQTLDELKAVIDAATPGPWKWYGNANTYHIYLATTHSGRRYVMDFVRWGTNGAQPRFRQPERGMVAAKHIVQFEVGDRSIVGIDSARNDESVYRYDIRSVDNADARFIATFNPALVAELVERVEKAERELDEATDDCRRANELINASIDDFNREKTRAEAAEARVKVLEEALEPFRSGGNWRTYKSWLTFGPPTQAKGFLAAKQITEWQLIVNRAAMQRTGDTHERD